MAAEKVDRRVRYTKRALTQALVQLVQERPVSKISVKELCERADVNRSTFYAHFRNPHDLLQSIENDARIETADSSGRLWSCRTSSTFSLRIGWA